MAAEAGSPPETIFARFIASALRNRDRPALLVHEGRVHTPITYAELLAEVDIAAEHLSHLGLCHGDALGILSANRAEWAITDLACMKIGAVVVPIYPTLSPATIKYMIADSGLKILVVENRDLLLTAMTARRDLYGRWPCLLIESRDVEPEDAVIPFAKLREPIAAAQSQSRPVTPEDAATIVYTSGTTGEPKGVVLTHRNIVANVRAVIDRYQVSDGDVIVSYLPLCHMLERTCGYYAMLFSGATIAYAESISTVFRDVIRIRPTIMLTVPRVIDKAFEYAAAEVGRGSRVKRWLVDLTIKDLNARADLRYQGKRVGPWLRLRCALLDRTIAAQFRKIGGGRLRILASGGAPLDRRIAKTYYVLGYNIVEGYGLTETSPVVCSNSISENTLGTVGRPVLGVDVRVGDNDEILVRGPNVMRGYHNKPEETARTIDVDGWFHTGDQGRFDPRGNLVITGRIKDLIVTAYGKNVPAAAIELRITQSPYISQAMLYGDRMKYIVALIVPFRDATERLAEEIGIATDGYPTLLNNEEIRSFFAQEIERATADLSHFEQVKNFSLIEEEFSVANGLLTPLMKLRRSQVAERYRSTIASMYDERTEGKSR